MPTCLLEGLKAGHMGGSVRNRVAVAGAVPLPGARLAGLRVLDVPHVPTLLPGACGSTHRTYVWAGQWEVPWKTGEWKAAWG